MRLVSHVSLVSSVFVLLACQANRPPPEQPQQRRPSAPPAMTVEQIEEVQAVLQRGSGTLSLRCYQAELDRRGESFEAKAMVKILVQADGRVGAVEFGESTVDASFRSCIHRVIRTWQFPRLPESAWFTYPLSFSPDY